MRMSDMDNMRDRMVGTFEGSRYDVFMVSIREVEMKSWK